MFGSTIVTSSANANVEILNFVSLGLIIVSILFFILLVEVCFAIISIKKSVNDIADMYCTINKEKYKEAKNKSNSDTQKIE